MIDEEPYHLVIKIQLSLYYFLGPKLCGNVMETDGELLYWLLTYQPCHASIHRAPLETSSASRPVGPLSPRVLTSHLLTLFGPLDCPTIYLRLTVSVVSDRIYDFTMPTRFQFTLPAVNPHIWFCLFIQVHPVQEIPDWWLSKVNMQQNDLELDPATMCDCGRRFNGFRSPHIHKVCWCKQHNFPVREHKLIERIMNLDNTHCWVTAPWRNSKQAKNPVAQK